jgi:RNA polymerase sigma-70 factor (ECF subfamily)
MTATPPNLDLLLAQTDWVRALARRLIADAHEADDVVQSTWLAFLRRPLTNRQSVEALRAWLATTLRRNASRRSIERERRIAREHGAARSERTPSASDVVEQESVRRALVDAVLALDDPHRSVLLLRYFDGLAPNEIADRLGIPASTVRSHLSRGLASLRHRLEHERGARWKQWCLLVVPLAKSSTAAGAGMTGGVLMSSKLKLAALFAIVLCGSFVAWKALDLTASSQSQAKDARSLAKLEKPLPLAEKPPASKPDRNAPETAAVASAEARRESAAPADATPTDPVGILVFGSIVDETGTPLAYRRHGPPGHVSMNVRFTEEHGDDVWVAVNQKGSYSQAGLHAGHWSVSIWGEGFRQTSSELELAATQPIRRFDLVVHHAVLLRVKIVTPDGQPLRDALKSEAGFEPFVGPIAVASAEPPGAFLPEVLFGGYTEAESSLYWGWGSNIGAAPVPVPESCAGILEVLGDLPAYVSLVHRTLVLETKSVPAGSEEVVFTLSVDKLRTSVGRARLHVVDAMTGEALQAEASLGEAGGSAATQPTDKEGAVEFQNLVPGNLALQVGCPDHELLHQIVWIKPGELTDLGTVRLSSAASIEGRVVGDAGEPVSAVVKIAEVGASNEYYLWNGWSTKTSGTFEVKDLGRKQYWIWAAAGNESGNGENALLSPPLVADTRGGSVRAMELKLARCTRLLVRFKSEIPWGSDIRLVDAAGAPVGYSWLRDGNKMRPYTVLRALPGEYTVQLVARGSVIRGEHVTLSGANVEIDF